MFKILIVIAMILVSCAKKTPVPGISATPANIDAVTARREALRPHLPYCQYTSNLKGVSKDTCLPEHTGTGDGDIMLFAGFLCLSGEEIGCQTVKASCTESGQCFRSPGRVGVDTENEFSRDMALGLMAYLIKTRDLNLANNWLGWVEANGGKTCEHPTDNRCELKSTTWGMIGEVWAHLGLPLTSKMTQGRKYDDVTQWVSSDVSYPGYQQHLIALTVLLHQKMGTYTTYHERSIDMLQRDQPDNPLFEFIRYGATDRCIRLVMKKALVGTLSNRDEWSLERSEDDKSWERSMGWEWVFLINLIAR